ncbi:hypothetical protein [Sphingomonas sp. Root241]|uniref:hypothetical protein n=1 Tax=Sphingomonas sp. Root241 TaxID=1736501 RepID=UPI000714C27D|nr:hypothetical protein [Sphingomonas sp. Root241]KRC82050.1 hypothetical protein ASE13_06870 [Sphingomonas sp. Root241]
MSCQVIGLNGLIGAAALISCVVISPAAAQKTGTRLDQNRGAVGSISKLDKKSAIRATHAFGQCIAYRETKKAQRSLELPFASAEQLKVLNEATNSFDACLGTSPEFDLLSFPPVLFAGSAAEYFVRLKYAKSDLGGLAGITDEALDKTEFRPRNALEDLGMCVVRRNPGNARALVLTRPTETEEAEALKILLPDIGPCVFEGQQVSLNTPNLRAIIAYALYRAASKLGAAGA